MKKIMGSLFVILMLALMMPVSAGAQEVAHVVDTTVAVDADVRSAVDEWLSTSAPVDVPYYAITYTEARGMGTFVSLVALTITDPTAMWHATDSNDIAWMGSIEVRSDYSAQLLTQEPSAKSYQASPSLAPGGGQNIRFPWNAGGAMMYGPRAVHAAGGGGAYATGFSAVDFVGGDDMGSGVAPNKVYAVTGGVVDYLCADDTTTLVRVVDSATNNRFIYAHMLDNANLVDAHAFSAGAFMGSLKYGTFDDNCGWAEQSNKHYHLHFGFEPANGTMRMENCTLTISTEKWMCGTTTIVPGKFLIGGGGVSDGGGDDGTGAMMQPGFFDYFLAGIISLWDRGIIQNLPSHTALPYTYTIYSLVDIFLRFIYVFLFSNVNLFWLMKVIKWATTIGAVFGLIQFFVFPFRAVKNLFPFV